jgi:hypothetical protein
MTDPGPILDEDEESDDDEFIEEIIGIDKK